MLQLLINILWDITGFQTIYFCLVSLKYLIDCPQTAPLTSTLCGEHGRHVLQNVIANISTDCTDHCSHTVLSNHQHIYFKGQECFQQMLKE